MMICRGSQFCYLRILTLYNKEIDKFIDYFMHYTVNNERSKIFCPIFLVSRMLCPNGSSNVQQLRWEFIKERFKEKKKKENTLSTKKKSKIQEKKKKTR